MPITNEVLDQILKGYEKTEDLLSENGLLQQLTKALVERVLNGEMTHYLGCEKYDIANNHQKPSNVSVRRSGLQNSVFSLEKYQ